MRKMAGFEDEIQRFLMRFEILKSNFDLDQEKSS